MENPLVKKRVFCPNVSFAMMSLPLLFVLAVIIGYFGYISFKVEIHTLITVTFIFIIFLFFIPHNASYASCQIARNFIPMEEELQDGLRRNALTIMGKTKSTLSVRDFMEEYFKDVRDDNYAKVASSIFPMLGILGTFIAIAISMPDFTVSSGEKLDKEISILLSGVGTAFYASIYGIFLSLWWIFFERRGLAKIEKQIIALEELYRGKIWTKSELIKHEHMESELKDQKIIQTLKETFNIDFIKETNLQYMNQYQKMIEDTNKSFLTIAKHLKESSEDLKETLDKLSTKQESLRAEEAISQNIESFIKANRELHEALEHFDESVERNLEKIDYELASAIERLGRMTETIIKEHKRMRIRSYSSHKEDKNV